MLTKNYKTKKSNNVKTSSSIKSKILNSILFLFIGLFFLFLTNIVFGFLYTTNVIPNLEVASSLATELTFILTVLSYLIFVKKINKGFSKELGLSLNTLTSKNILLGIGIFITLVFFTIILSLGLSYTTTSKITGNTSAIFQNSPAPPPIWFYFFVAVIAPIIEEITFRGLLVKRIGIIPSAIIFGILHSGYYSSINITSFALLITAATVFGILAGYAYKKTNSIYPSIVAHILENSLAVLSLF